jgi:hypothetical protein
VLAGGGDKKSAKAKSGPGNFPYPVGEARDQVAAIVGVDPTTISRAPPV